MSTAAAADREAVRAAQHPHRFRGLAIICLTQIVSWGILYYSLPVAADAITSDTGWAATTVMGVLTAAMLVQAAVAVPAGHLLAHFGPRAVMTGGSLIAAGAVAITTLPHLAAFVCGWLIAGAAMSAVLYQAAFAAANEWFAPRSTNALTIVTLFGGLASTVFAPLISAMLALIEWRTTYLILAGVLLSVVALHVFLPRRSTAPADVARGSKPDRVAIGVVLRSKTFLALAAALSLSTLGISAANLNLIPFLQERGLSHGVAAVALGVCGFGQIIGRLGYPALARRVPVLRRTALSIGFSAMAVVALAVSPPTAVVALVLAGLLGAARGVATLIHASGVAELWGSRDYAVISGYLSMAIALAGAVAPWAGAIAATLAGGYVPGFLLLAALTGASVIVLLVGAKGGARARR